MDYISPSKIVPPETQFLSVTYIRSHIGHCFYQSIQSIAISINRIQFIARIWSYAHTLGNSRLLLISSQFFVFSYTK